MDYRELLKKYIAYIGQVEGDRFINGTQNHRAETEFSDEEWAELQKLDTETPWWKQ